MEYEPTLEEVKAFIADFRDDFGVTIPLEDAERILILYEELSALFEQYSDGETPLYQFFER
jgi:hypothetical protein